MLFQILTFILPIFQQLLLKGMLVFSHKIVFIESEITLLCETMQERARAFAALCCYQNQKFSVVPHSCRSCSTYVARVSLVLVALHSCRICSARVALVSLVSGTRVVN